jgi:cell division protein FtsI (penicillin-binding protein 3)
MRDAKQRELVAKQHDLVMPVDGYDLKLTLDIVLQHAADQFLKEACETHRALGGSLVVMDAFTGDVMAMSNFPAFNPNESSTSDPQTRRNRAITDVYEPGSVFKIFTAAAALEEQKFHLDDLIYCEQGEFRTGGRILHDVHPYGKLSFSDVMAKSSNIGTAKIAMELGANSLYEYIRKFGFGEKTGIDLPGEVSGILSHPKTWSKTSISSVPMGQEVAVTAIQLAAGASAMVNGGILMKPRIVQSISSGDQFIKEFPTTQIRQVVSQKTSDQIKQILRRAVETGTGKNAIVKGHVVGGKTGTAQKIEPDGSYSHSHFIGSFLGYVEHEGKVMTILVSIDDPSPRYYGGTVAAPVFAKMARIILDVWRA